jgi:hypothetical protein
VLEHLSESVAQSLIAALVAEALMRLWDLSSPHQRFQWRLASLVGPGGLLLAFELFAPVRHSERFTDGPALYATRHLAALTVEGVGFDRLWPWPVCALGLVLLGRELWPLVFQQTSALPPEIGPGPAKVRAMVERLCAVRRLEVPSVVEVRAAEPLVLCVGVLHPRLLVSRSLLEVLDEAELEAALAHELAHVYRRDVLWGWVLLWLRILQAFNPVAQVVGRLCALELEVRADAEAARWTGRPASLASAVLKVYGRGHSWPGWGELTLADQIERARTSAIEERCRRLLAAKRGPSKPPGPVLTTVAAFGIAALLFFVT